jgi:hypothetical protein
VRDIFGEATSGAIQSTSAIVGQGGERFGGAIQILNCLSSHPIVVGREMSSPRKGGGMLPCPVLPHNGSPFW